MPTKDEIEAGMRQIGDRLSRDCSFTHFGGCNMTLQGIKDTTRDVDVILEPAEHFGLLVEDLEDLYEWTTQNEAKQAFVPDHLRGVLTEWEVLQGPLAIDLFPMDRIFDSLSFTPDLLTRRTLRFQAGRLKVLQADVTTTFMLKAVTGRWHKTPDRDLEDLRDILTKRGHEVDWLFLNQEWDRQMRACPDPSKANRYAREAVSHLLDAGYTVDWHVDDDPVQ